MNDQPWVAVAGCLFDGSGRLPEKDIAIEVTNGCISNIRSAAGSGVEGYAEVVDLSDCCVLPPFIDAHVHLTMSGSLDQAVRKKQLNANYDYFEPVITGHLENLLNHGVYAVRDGGDRIGAVLRYRDGRQRNNDSAPVILSSGRAWYRQGRYGALIGRAVAKDALLDEEMMTDHEPADQVKLVNSGLNSLEEFARETRPQFSSEELAGAVGFAAAHSRKVMVHANGRLPVMQAVRAGCHSIEHGFFMGRKTLQLMAEYRSCWVPTVYTMKAYLQGIRSAQVSGSADVIERTIEHQLQQLRDAKEEGVAVAVGTDSGSSGVFHGTSFSGELRLFSDAGYSIQEIIRCATANGADLLGLDTTRGLIEKEGPAHFLAVRGGSESLLKNFSSIERMYLHGARVL